MLADNLRKIRKEHKLTQQNIADVLGIDRTTYTSYETGTSTPSPATLYKLSKIYNVSIGYIMGVEENFPTPKKKNTRTHVSSGNDVITMLKKDEKELLMCYRVADEKSKQIILDYIKRIAQESETDI